VKKNDTQIIQEGTPQNCCFGDALFKPHTFSVIFTIKKSHYSVYIHPYILKLGNSTNQAMAFIVVIYDACVTMKEGRREKNISIAIGRIGRIRTHVLGIV